MLVHTVSYALTDYLEKFLRSRVSIRRIFRYTSAGQRELVLRKFKKTTGGILLAPSMSRGVDLPGDDCEVVVQGARVSVGREAWITEAGHCRFFFGWRSDPFFLDVMGNFNQMQFTGDDFFKNKDVCSIVLEVPNSELRSNEVGIWARTVDKNGEGWVQADRGARPLQTVFLVGDEREAYLGGEPANDDRFIGMFAHELEHSGGYAPEDAKAVARKLLPDILSYRPHEPARYPHNGRTLTDDVVDLFFSMYSNRNVTDKVGPHSDLLDEFPYLGPPHD
jgi:hypothetical protein